MRRGSQIEDYDQHMMLAPAIIIGLAGLLTERGEATASPAFTSRLLFFCNYDAT